MTENDHFFYALAANLGFIEIPTYIIVFWVRSIVDVLSGALPGL